MKLKSILYGLENLRAKGDLDIDIPNIENDSRKVQQGDICNILIFSSLKNN